MLIAMDRAEPCSFYPVRVLEMDGLVFKCRIGDRVVRVPPLRILPGTTVHRAGDCGVLVIPVDVAEELGLGQDSD